MHWNVKDFRQHFPFFNNNEQIVYLDNAATTQKNIETINKLNEFYEYYNANVHRGVHYLSAKATELFEKSRIILQQYINAKYDHEIIFTKGTTEAINLVA